MDKIELFLKIRNKDGGYIIKVDTEYKWTLDFASTTIFPLNSEEELENAAEACAIVISQMDEHSPFTFEIVQKDISTSSAVEKVMVKIKANMSGLSLLGEPEADDIHMEIGKHLSSAIADNLLTNNLDALYKKAKSAKSLLSEAMEEAGITSSKPKGPMTASEEEAFLSDIADKTDSDIVKPTETLETDYICEPELMDELKEISSFFNDRDKYISRGIEIPKGILIKGPPGTGKTYAARCIAGSTNCVFMSTTASALQGKYIGSGAENIRKLFKGAKYIYNNLHKGVIIFIDELDSLGSRESHNGSAGGEEDRTLNQLLSELSGFMPTEHIMVIAATNFPERLDSALTRSGRMERHLTITYPNQKERLHIINHYFKKHKLIDTNTEEISRLTEGCTPADLKMVANESAIMSVRQSSDDIKLDYINEAINRVLTKNVKRFSPDKDYKLVAAHEMGHVLGEYLYNNKFAVKVTCESYGDAGGFTQMDHKHNTLKSQDQLIADVKTLLAGRAAEQVVMGRITVGASDDLRRVKSILESFYKVYHFQNYTHKELEQVILDDLTKYYNDVLNDFTTNKALLVDMTDKLLLHKTLYSTDIKALIKPKEALSC